MDDTTLLTVAEYRSRYKCSKATVHRRLNAGKAVRVQPGGPHTKLLILPHEPLPVAKVEAPTTCVEQTTKSRPRGPQPRWLK